MTSLWHYELKAYSSLKDTQKSEFASNWRTEGSHGVEFAVTGGTGGRLNDTLRCRKWRLKSSSWQQWTGHVRTRRNTVNGLWKTAKTLIGHMIPVCIATRGNPKLYLDQPIKTRRCKPNVCYVSYLSQIANIMGPTWGPPGSCRPQMGPMLAPWTLLLGHC